MNNSTLCENKTLNAKPARHSTLTSVTAFALVLGFSAAANANLITNGSFEYGDYCGDPDFCSLSAGSTAITGWTVTRDGVDWVEGYWQAADGIRSLDMSGNEPGGITASTTFNTVAGRNYMLEFAMSGNPDGGPDVKSLAVGVTPNAGIIDPASAVFYYDTAAMNNTLSDMRWVTQELLFTGFGGPTVLSFENIDYPGTAYGAAIDRVRVTEVSVPEPGTLFLLTAGLLGLVARRTKLFARKLSL